MSKIKIWKMTFSSQKQICLAFCWCYRRIDSLKFAELKGCVSCLFVCPSIHPSYRSRALYFFKQCNLMQNYSSLKLKEICKGFYSILFYLLRTSFVTVTLTLSSGDHQWFPAYISGSQDITHGTKESDHNERGKNYFSDDFTSCWRDFFTFCFYFVV